MATLNALTMDQNDNQMYAGGSPTFNEAGGTQVDPNAANSGWLQNLQGWLGQPGNQMLLGQLGGLAGSTYGDYRAQGALEDLPTFQWDQNNVYDNEWNQRAMDAVKNQVQSASMARGNPFGNRGLQEIADNTYARHLLPALQMDYQAQLGQYNSRYNAALEAARAKAGFWQNTGKNINEGSQAIGDQKLNSQVVGWLQQLLKGGGGSGGTTGLDNLDGYTDTNFYSDLASLGSQQDFSMLNDTYNSDDLSTYNWADNFNMYDDNNQSYDYSVSPDWMDQFNSEYL